MPANTLLRDAATLIADQSTHERAIAEQFWHEGYQAGRDDGYAVGFAAAHSQLDADWAKLAADISRQAHTRSHTEQEHVRWDGPRERFGRARPGDYAGGPVPWQTGEVAA